MTDEDRDLLRILNSNVKALIELLTYDTGRDAPKDWVSAGESLDGYSERTNNKKSVKRGPRDEPAMCRALHVAFGADWFSAKQAAGVIQRSYDTALSFLSWASDRSGTRDLFGFTEDLGNWRIEFEFRPGHTSNWYRVRKGKKKSLANR